MNKMIEEPGTGVDCSLKCTPPRVTLFQSLSLIPPQLWETPVEEEEESGKLLGKF